MPKEKWFDDRAVELNLRLTIIPGRTNDGDLKFAVYAQEDDERERGLSLIRVGLSASVGADRARKTTADGGATAKMGILGRWLLWELRRGTKVFLRWLNEEDNLILFLLLVCLWPIVILVFILRFLWELLQDWAKED